MVTELGYRQLRVRIQPYLSTEPLLVSPNQTRLREMLVAFLPEFGFNVSVSIWVFQKQS